MSEKTSEKRVYLFGNGKAEGDEFDWCTCPTGLHDYH